MFVVTDTGGRVVATSPEATLLQSVEADMPDGWDASHQEDWVLIDGEWQYDPLPPAPPVPTEAERLAAVEAALLELALGGELYG